MWAGAETIASAAASGSPAAAASMTSWTAVAVVVLVLSFLPVAGVEASGGAKAVLALAHLAVGAVLIPLFWRTTRETGR